MGRKNEIEGQINLFDMMVFPKEALEEDNKKLEKEAEQRMQEVSQKSIQKSEKNIEELKTINKKSENEEAGEQGKKFTPGAFPECTSCWCSTCEHSTVGGSIPRPFAGSRRPCPSCELCVSEGAADICVIGSADEGCRYRAEKEGLIPE